MHSSASYRLDADAAPPSAHQHQHQQQQSLPFNPRNKLIQEADARRIVEEFVPPALLGESSIGDVNLYRKAMTHRSYCTRKNENFFEGNQRCPPGCVPLQEESNERLEFLGDAVLNLVVGGYLYDRFPDENEGFLTKMRTKLVNGGMLAQLCGKCGLSQWVILSRQLEEGSGRTNKKVMEDVFESFLGALYLDHGFVAAQQWIIGFIENHIDFTDLIKQQSNYKDALAKYFQHTFNSLPRYVDIDMDVSSPSIVHSDSLVLPSIASTSVASTSVASTSVASTSVASTTICSGSSCTVCIKDKFGTIVGLGKAPNKKLAENEAARRALQYYGQLTS